MNDKELEPSSRRIAQLIDETLEHERAQHGPKSKHRSGTYPRSQRSLLELSDPDDTTNTNNSRVA